MSRKLRAAVVGCGRIASGFAADPKRKGIISTHAQAYLADKRTELAAACDLDPVKLSQFGKTWNVKALYTDLAEMLKKEKPDVLSICTWNGTHRAIFEAAVRAGVRGVICEKPVSDTLEASDAMIALSKRSGVPLLVNYTRRYVKLYHSLKARIERGELGAIQGVSAYYTAGTVNTATHLFDYLRFFFGDADWVWADPSKKLGEADPSYSGYVHFEKGFGCTLTALDVASYLVFEADVYGTRKRVRLAESGTRADVWDVVPHPLFSGYHALNAGRSLTGDLGEGLPGLVRDLVSCVNGDREPVCSAVDGRASLEIATALRLSFEAGGKKIGLPLKKRDVKMSSR